MTNQEIQERVIKMKGIENQVKELNASISTLKKEIQKELEDRNVDMVETELFKVWWKLEDVNTFQTKLFKEKYSELYEMYLKHDCTPKFRITSNN